MHYKAHRFQYEGAITIPLQTPSVPAGTPGDVSGGTERSAAWICHPTCFTVAPDNGEHIGVAFAATKIKDRVWYKSMVNAAVKSGTKKRMAQREALEKIGNYVHVTRIVDIKIYPNDTGDGGYIDTKGPEGIVYDAISQLKRFGAESFSPVTIPSPNQWVRAILAADLPTKTIEQIVGPMTRTTNTAVMPHVIESEELRAAQIAVTTDDGVSILINAKPGRWDVRLTIPPTLDDALTKDEDADTIDYFAKFIEPLRVLAETAETTPIDVTLLEQQQGG